MSVLHLKHNIFLDKTYLSNLALNVISRSCANIPMSELLSTHQTIKFAIFQQFAVNYYSSLRNFNISKDASCNKCLKNLNL